MWFTWRPEIITQFDEGATFYFDGYSSITKQISIGERSSVVQGVSTGVLTLMLMLVGYLAFSDTADKLSRYVGYFTLCSLLMNAGFTIKYYLLAHVTPYFNDITAIVNNIGAAGRPLSLLLVMAAFFSRRVQRWQVVLFGILCLYWFLLQNSWIYADIRALLYILIFTIITAIAVVYIRHSKFVVSTWVMALAIIIVYAQVIGESSRVFINIPLLRFFNSFALTLLSYIAVPIAFAFVLVRRTAQDRKRLAQYNQDLERQVAERTQELQSANEEISLQMRTQSEQSREIEEKNTELQESLETLRRTQTQLAQAEKMASLGTLVAGVAHELNTPIGVAVTAASTLHGRTQDFAKRYTEGGLKKSELEAYVQTAQTGADLTLRNLERAANLIQSFKQVAVDQTSDQKRRFNLHQYVQGVITSLEPKWKTTNHRVEIECYGTIELETYPGAIAQIITNLIENSLLHGFQGYTESGIMRIVAEKDGDRIMLKYSDNGRGIPAEVLPRIFDPFFTTKQAQGGTGLGMHIVYNLVTQKLGGEIRCSSESGVGTTFTLSLPQRL